MTDSIFLLDENTEFPPVELSQEEPNGLLAVGGDLSIERLLQAYSSGIFPWYCEGEPILWWSPDPRCVFDLSQEKPMHISKSLKKKLNRSNYKIIINQQFAKVISSCSMPRAKQAETWILPEMQQAYCHLNQAGFAHSIEVYDTGDNLLGGLYGVSLGKFFFGESMFSKKPDASKMILSHLVYYLKQAGFLLIDCQVPNEHLYSLGALDIERDKFVSLLNEHKNWQQPQDLFRVSKELVHWE